MARGRFLSKQLHFYTDGSVYRVEGGWAVCISFDGIEVYRKFGGYARGTTIARMEMRAVISSLHWIRLHLPKGMEAVIHCDSKFIVDSINEDWIGNWQYLGWEKPNGDPRPNRDLWEEFLHVRNALDRRKFKYKIQWIKAHDERGLNEVADKCANRNRRRKTPNRKYE